MSFMFLCQKLYVLLCFYVKEKRLCVSVFQIQTAQLDIEPQAFTDGMGVNVCGLMFLRSSARHCLRVCTLI